MFRLGEFIILLISSALVWIAGCHGCSLRVRAGTVLTCVAAVIPADIVIRAIYRRAGGTEPDSTSMLIFSWLMLAVTLVLVVLLWNRSKWEKGWETYLALWSGPKNARLLLMYVLHFTLLFAVMWFFLYTVPFARMGRNYIWTQDGMTQTFTGTVYLSKALRNGFADLFSGRGWTFPMYDFQSPTRTAVSTEPLQLLAALFPLERMEFAYNFLTALRFYLSGLAFLLLCWYFELNPWGALAGAVTYTFCGYAVGFFGIGYGTFEATMILFPLLVFGAEKILRKKKPYCFIAVVCISVITSVYLAVMMGVLIILYALVRIPDLYEGQETKGKLRIWGSFLLCGFLGILLSGVVLIPSLLQNLSTGRIGRSVFKRGFLSEFLFYGKSYYSGFLNYFLAVEKQIDDKETFLGFSLLTIPAIAQLFLDRDRKSRTLRVLFVLLTLMLWIPTAAYILSAFNATFNRFCFAYALCVSFILAARLPDLIAESKEELAVTGAICLSYFFVCRFITDQAYYQSDAMLLLMVGFAAVCAGRYIPRKQMALFFLILTCFSVYYAVYTNTVYERNPWNPVSVHITRFNEVGRAREYYERSEYGLIDASGVNSGESGFYRACGDIAQRESISASFLYDINGLSFHNSYAYPAYMEWLSEMESPRLMDNIMDFGPIARTQLLSQLSVRYYALRNEGSIHPYGFTKAGEAVDNSSLGVTMYSVSRYGDPVTHEILENPYYLPVGYTYVAYTPRSEYLELHPVDREALQLSSLVLEEAPKDLTIERAYAQTDSTADRLKTKIVAMNGLRWENGILTVDYSGASMTLALDGGKNVEWYLRLVGLDLTGFENSTYCLITADAGNGESYACFTDTDYEYANGASTQLLDLGYSRARRENITIWFYMTGQAKLDDIEVWSRPMGRYAEQINALREESLENVAFNWRGLTGDITVSRDKMLCFSIPYDSGWTAYVDGQKTKLYQANTAFMAVELPVGYHTVELRYWTPGLTAGIAMSAAGVVGLAVMAVLRKKAKAVVCADRQDVAVADTEEDPCPFPQGTEETEMNE